MRSGISLDVSPADRRRLEALIGDRNTAQKHVWRARIILLSDDGVGTMAIARHAGVAKPCVWRWQERFMTAGVDGLLRDKTRPPRIPPLGADVAARVVALTTTGEPPGETTHWTAAVKRQPGVHDLGVELEGDDAAPDREGHRHRSHHRQADVLDEQPQAEPDVQ